MYPSSIQKLIEQFAKFPTIGPRTATRFVFYLLKAPKEEIENLVHLINGLKQNVKLCNFCFNPFEGEGKLDPICRSPQRDKNLLCIVEKEADLNSLEKTKKYKGLYFIIGGTVSTLKKEDLRQLRTEELKQRIEKPENFGVSGTDFKEIIIATNPTPEGEATALYLERLLKPFNKKITRLAKGLPVGGELEYADPDTLESALQTRK